MSKNELQPFEQSGFLAAANADYTDLLAELDGMDVRPDKIKIPAGGGLAFEVPGEDGEPEMAKEFSAVILFHHPMNAFYEGKYTGGHQPPDCASLDGKIAADRATGEVRSCTDCPKNEFGSKDDSGGKACQNRRRLFLLREGELFPVVLNLPAGSLQPFNDYVRTLLNKRTKTSFVVTRFRLKKVQSVGGVDYSQAQFSVDRPLEPAEKDFVARLSAQFADLAKADGFDDAAPADTDPGNAVEPLN